MRLVIDRLGPRPGDPVIVGLMRHVAIMEKIDEVEGHHQVRSTEDPRT